ncbi:hypothetical protein TNIN_73191 [Trichonephila inaurata madagascariensis]|uniref:Transmembrane protein n=1 Tax=Trichonephila inaurata madagascariensis TaxID=2747483 RepID=A0A8X7C3F8_9ARAC|nr:hypothetical protein TNIN_73191 [Trichonephila inaurata madagascariensis]
MTDLASSDSLFCFPFTTSEKVGFGCVLLSLRAAARSCQTFFVGLFFAGFSVYWILGASREVCRVRATSQFAHLAGASADLVHSEMRWPPEHFKHFGALAQNRE